MGATGNPGVGKLDQAVDAIRKSCSSLPRAAVILGSGLGAYGDTLVDGGSLAFTDIPGFPRPTVPGHTGRLVWGKKGDAQVVLQAGRFHRYEGFSPPAIAFPVRVMRALGAETLVVTNAAGSLTTDMNPGDLMLIEDQINFQFTSPLVGLEPGPDAERFIDMSAPFSRRLLSLARDAGAAAGVGRLHTGTYWGNVGPAYETPAEVRMAGELGGRAVGMSTIFEVIAARQLGMEVLGVCVVTNLAAGLTSTRLSHEEVLKTGSRVSRRVSGLLDEVLQRL